jgi:ATP-dependent 26S proteasome regulatory subunit
MELLTQMDGFEQSTNVKVRVASGGAAGGLAGG